MLCDNCRENEATVHIVKMADGEKSELNFCEDCAREKKEIGFSLGPQFSLHKLFSSLINQKLRSSREAEQAARLQCPECGLTFAQFGQVGRLGCSCCIDTFSEKMNPLLARIHAGPIHTGKVPVSLRSRVRLRREMNRLQEELQLKVKNEEFEEAAELRDRIRAMKGEIAAEEAAREDCPSNNQLRTENCEENSERALDADSAGRKGEGFAPPRAGNEPEADGEGINPEDNKGEEK